MNENEYIDLVKQRTQIPKNTSFSKNGSLCLLYIEFRHLDIIPYNLNNICNVYGGKNVGLTIVHSTENKDLVYNSTKNWKNVKYVQALDHCGTLDIYNKLLASSEFWLNFKEFEYVLVNQWDSYLFREVSDKFLNFDYIGGTSDHIYCRRNNEIFNICGDTCGCGNCIRKQSTFNYHPYDVIYNVGNGGFSLRKVEKMIELCNKKQYNGEPEDVYFCMSYLTQPSRLESSEFSVQDWKYDGIPVGCHKIWENQPREYILELFNHVD